MGCGLPVDTDAPGGLCPQCLLKSGVGSPASEAGAPNATPIPGESFGSYRILRLLGHGGMGRVYEAEHAETGRRVALKVIAAALAGDADRKRFLREGRLAAAVNHPNVVYIHGSEEIDGVPAIAMELVHGGTLKDRLKQEGALPVNDAVEAALDIISGLEAAHAAGVLHRDIKPANCFISGDGTVKVGDFGLSVSTLARGESLLTAAGSVLGTPAYASPEQLRGEELDVRSDIYSVGATLYHLLTGKTPFASADFVKLITEVLDKQPAAPATLRGEIPSELSRVVMRCLAKDRKTRFQNYAELRDALLPFRRADAIPAKPAFRFVAGLVDDMIAYLPSAVYLSFWSLDPLDMLVRDRTLHAALVWLAFYSWYFIYFAVTEGLWGAALGKTLCGLRVVDAVGQAPGIGRAAVRTLIYMLPGLLPSFALIAFVSQQSLLTKLAHGQSWVSDWLWIPLSIALFVTMRKRNGYAAIHDLASRTRVVVRPKTQPRPMLSDVEAGPPSTPDAGAAQALPAFGSYETRGLLWRHGQEELWLAHDPMLRRHLWIHVRPGDGAAVSAARRDLSRPARLRWLNCGQSAGMIWDAYEALTGASFQQVCARPHPWNAVRFWLTDLAEEIVSAQGDAAAPVLALNRLWITRNSHAVLLDFPAPGDHAGIDGQVYPCDDAAAAQGFLAAVASNAMHRDDPGARTPIPLHAEQFIETLRRAAFDKIEFIPGNLHSLLAKPAELTRARRTASLALVPAIAAIFSIGVAGYVVAERIRSDRTWQAFYPDKPPFRIAARVLSTEIDQAGEDAETVRLGRIYIVRHFSDVLTNQAFWKSTDFADAPRYERQLRRDLREAPAASPAEIVHAEEWMTRRIREKSREEQLVAPFMALASAIVVMIISALVAFATIVLFGVNPVLHLFGIAVVNCTGRPADRGRLILRWLLAWGGVAFVCVLGRLFGLVVSSQVVFSDELIEVRRSALVVGPVILLGLIAFAVYAALRPNRAAPDLLTRTFLVPK